MFKSNGNLKRRILSVNVYLFKEVSILKASIYYSFSLWEVTRVKLEENYAERKLDISKRVA